MGYVIDPAANEAPARAARDIATAASRSRVLVIPTDEEGMIARDTAAIAQGL